MGELYGAASKTVPPKVATIAHLNTIEALYKQFTPADLSALLLLKCKKEGPAQPSAIWTVF